MTPCMQSGYFYRQISHEYVRSSINLKYCMMGYCVMRLCITLVDPCLSIDFVIFVFAFATSVCNELQLSIVDVF